MAEKVPKRAAKPSGVLGKLPASRPERLGTPRGAKKKPAPKRKVVAAKPMAAKARNPKSGATAVANGHQGPQAVRPGSSALPPPRTCEPPPKPLGAPRGTELVTTTIRAAGELTQIGFTLGGQVLKRAVARIPRPGNRSSDS